MARSSAIEWTQATLNPWTGCTKVDPACAHCYIENTPPFRIAGRRFEHGHIPLVFHLDRLAAMVRRRKPTLYFVNSLSDLFHEDASDDQIAQVFAAMASAPQHTFQILTKRHERMRDLMRSDLFILNVANRVTADTLLPIDWPLRNVWLGVTIGNRRFVHRAQVLADTPAAVRFLSCEPLLGPLIPDMITVGDEGKSYTWPDGYTGPGLQFYDVDGNLAFDWVIIGGESGPRHRRFDLAWARDLRDVCLHEGVAVFVKQLGGARPGTALEDLPADLRIREFPTVAR